MVGLVSTAKPLNVKITAFGASNTINDADNLGRPYPVQATGRFKTGAQVFNAAVSGIGAATSVSSWFATAAQPQYDSSKTTNILTMQFAGGNTGDITSDPATVTPFYNNLVTLSQRWKALGTGTKVVLFTLLGYGCPDSASATNYIAANNLILADSTNFDALVNCQNIDPVFTIGTSCPALYLSPDCDHLTVAGHLLLRDPYIAAVNSVY